MLPSYHEKGNNQVHEIAEREIESAKNPEASGGGASAVETGLSVCDFGG